MDPKLLKPIAIGALATWGIVYFFRARTSSERCRRATYDLLKSRGYDDLDALDRAGEYCGSAGGDVLSRDVP